MSATPPIHVSLSALDDATQWLNSEPLTAAALEGKVVAVQFGTYSCINWIRTLPYVRAWVRAYADDGLVIVGAQTPEFSFEHDIEGVRRSIAEMGLEHPIVLDNDYAIWRSLNNHYWPALYLLDGDGRLRYEHFGEGAYSETEEAFRELVGAEGERVRVEATGVEAAADWDSLRSPETYVGYAQAERRARGPAGELSLNEWALSGTWKDQEEAAELETAPGSIAYRFQARDLNLVLTPVGSEVPFTVLLDGQPPGDARGLDVDEQGAGTVSEPRLYQLVRQPGAVRERTFEIAFHEPGVRAHVFTFG